MNYMNAVQSISQISASGLNLPQGPFPHDSAADAPEAGILPSKPELSERQLKRRRHNRHKQSKAHLQIKIRELANAIKKHRTLHMRDAPMNCIYKRAWRLAVLERDNYACVRCGSTDNPTAHHIFMFVSDSTLRAFDINNGETLCDDCHKREHAHGDPMMNSVSQERRRRRVAELSDKGAKMRDELDHNYQNDTLRRELGRLVGLLNDVRREYANQGL